MLTFGLEFERKIIFCGVMKVFVIKFMVIVSVKIAIAEKVNL